VIGVAIALAGGFWLVRDAAWVHRIEPLRRLATITNDGITIARFINVEMAIEGFKERPILGWGQENYAAVFDKYYDPRMYAQEQWFDRTHNIIFDWLIAGGLFGLLAYLGLYAFALLALWRSGAFKPYERAIITGLMAGYFFYLLFTFDNITSYILFVSLLAYIIVRATADQKVEPSRVKPLPKESMPIVAAVMCVVTGSAIWFLNVDAIASNRLLIQSLMPQTAGATKNLELFKEALAYESVGTQEIREQLSQAAMSAIAQEGISQEIKQGFVQLSAVEMAAQMADAPYNARAPFFLGLMLDRAGAYADAKIALDEALKRSPKKQGILFELGLNALVRGASEESLAYFKQAYDLAPDYLDARYYYAASLIRAGRDQEADALIAPIVEAGNLNDQAIASAYADRGQYQKIVTIWTKWVEKHPTDLNGYLVLAGAHYSAGDQATSVQVLEAAKRSIPGESARIDTLIGQVRAGTAR
jgi:tetratricopeptide (TPR) repeat protein